MTAARTSHAKGTGVEGVPRDLDRSAVDHAVRIIEQVCWFAGRPDLIENHRQTHRSTGLAAAIRDHDTGKIFDWLIGEFSYQGVSDQVARDYIDAHGTLTWADLAEKLTGPSGCPKLSGYWRYHGCRYDKTSRTCAEPDHIATCPLPTHDLRNGRLNQLAYSLHLFVRDVCDGDLVAWIDDQLADADWLGSPDRLGSMRRAVTDPLRYVFGISDKVINMALATLFLGAPKGRARWNEVGATMIAVDTLVHNFLMRTGILARFHADHPYGPGCYGPGGCADILGVVASVIDASAFNPTYPAGFPRFVQAAVWRYCAQDGLNICNGNRIRDNDRCDNIYCRLRNCCDRLALREKAVNSVI